MGDPNITRRDAVKLGGASLAAVGLSGGVSASARPTDLAAVPATDYPDFRGKTVLIYTTGENTTQLLTEPAFVMQAGRLFLTGRVPALGWWPDGLSAAIAWDSVDKYFVFDSV